MFFCRLDYTVTKETYFEKNNQSPGVLLKIEGAVRHRIGSGLQEFKPYNQEPIIATPLKIPQDSQNRI